ncbi:MAG TPA: hypothetical protein PKA66_07350 [Gemmatimonadales bacterium]|nr:hypothetical protein [Gemmatimonadales bacterium]
MAAFLGGRERIAARQRQPLDGAMDLRDVVARFCAKYPGEFQAGAIPWRLFWLLYERLHVVLAMERVTQARAVGMGWGGKDAERLMRADITEAFGHG